MSRPILIVLLLFLVCAAGVGVYLVKHLPPTKVGDDTGTSEPGFDERALESGITFRMGFLPSEQGENFKINLYDHGCGVAVADFDGDGYDDVYFVNQLGRNALYRNKGDGTFEDVTEKAGVGLGDRICVGATFADYLNEGRQSLYVTSTRGGNVLFRNMGDGTFKDVTKEAGLSLVAHSQTAVFFDFDNDGFLDLLVTNTAKWTTDEFDQQAKFFAGPRDFFDLAASPIEYNVLYHNNRDGTFTDVTAKSGLKGLGWSGDVAVFDFDEDGYLDVLVTNMFGRSQLYHNNRDGKFTEVTKEKLGPTSWGAIGAKAFDFNNDGKLDLLIVDMHSDMWLEKSQAPRWQRVAADSEKKKFRKVTGPMVEQMMDKPALQQAIEETEKKFADALHIKYDEVIFGNTLFKNLGNGKFEEVSDRANMETFWPWGIATGDFDNDGYEDVYLPSGMGYPWFYWPSALKRNNGDGTFSNRAETWGMEPPRRGKHLKDQIGGLPAPRSSRCAATADFDRDGRLDIVTNNFNDAPYYFHNRLLRRNYVAFKLIGSKRTSASDGSNRDAIGAVVRLYEGKEIMTRQVHAAGGYLSQSSKTLHFGLGDNTAVDRIEIRWPSGKRQVIEHPEVNRLHEIAEPKQ